MVDIYGFSVSRDADRVVIRPSQAARSWVLPQLVAIVTVCFGLAGELGETPVVAAAMTVGLGWIAWEVCRRLLGRVTLAASGVTIQAFRQRTIPWQDIEAIDLTRGCRFAVELAWGRYCVRPAFRLLSGGRVRLPIPAGLSKNGLRPRQHTELVGIIVDEGARFSNRRLHVQTVQWLEPEPWA